MHSPFPPRNDPAIPVLTEVLDVPLPSSTPASPPAGRASPAARTEPSFAAPRTPDFEKEIEALRTAVLQDLLERVDPLLKGRMRTALELAAARALDDVAASLREELGRMVDEAVQKELIRREAADFQARSRPASE
ncbi:hypothetical protein [Pigmentiphaga sp.]|uniref:hypothetical protein n=1 Tax=Pigmentiphaga sp. TaxID=1977564 RepID=UPI0025F45E85|nr:hypothetical protein [Pigmentiphaga sp.]MBX6317472.1 hypothetical protein [Pigmentiphaga sp.]